MAFWCYSFWNASSAEEGGIGAAFLCILAKDAIHLSKHIKSVAFSSSRRQLPSNWQGANFAVILREPRPTLKECWISRFSKQAKYFIHKMKSYEVCPCRLMQIRRGKEGHLLLSTWARAVCILDELWGGFHFTLTASLLTAAVMSPSWKIPCRIRGFWNEVSSGLFMQRLLVVCNNCKIWDDNGHLFWQQHHAMS